MRHGRGRASRWAPAVSVVSGAGGGDVSATCTLIYVLPLAVDVDVDAVTYTSPTVDPTSRATLASLDAITVGFGPSLSGSIVTGEQSNGTSTCAVAEAVSGPLP